MDQIFRRISFGVGRPNNEPVDHEVLDKISKADFKPQRLMIDLAAKQLGTVGSGNHFVDLFKDEEGKLWIGVHFGSRGFGHKTTTGFIALSQGLSFNDRGKEGSMDAKPILFDLDSALGQDYIAAMNLAGEYAHAGRELVIAKVLTLLGNPEVTYDVHNHHNFAWLEEHFGEKYWVVRKGCTPAFPGQLGFIGANMEDTSVIIRGKDTPLSRKGLFSTVHGAGRVMSRTQAAGKRKWKRTRDGNVPSVVSKGAVDFDAVKSRLKDRVELRGAAADEAPECYKDLEAVLASHGETIEILHRLQPIGVAMAGEHEVDPYKD
jgi:tRNA-splicing ligase RtcB